MLGLSSRIAAAILGARVAISCGMLLRGTLVAAALGVSACTTNNVLSLRPDVDVGTQTAAVPSSGGMQDLVPDDLYLQQGETDQAAAAEEPVGLDPQLDASQPVDSSQPVEASLPIDPSIAMNQPVEIIEPVEPQEAPAPVLAAYPRMDEPQRSAANAGRRSLLPARVEAPRRLFRDLSPINEGGSCQIDYPDQGERPARQHRH